MAKKNERELKVCAMSGYNYKSVPAIRLMGQWLEAAGFHIGDPVLVKCEDGKLIISLDTARAELIEAESKRQNIRHSPSKRRFSAAGLVTLGWQLL